MTKINAPRYGLLFANSDLAARLKGKFQGCFAGARGTTSPASAVRPAEAAASGAAMVGRAARLAGARLERSGGGPAVW